MHSVVYWRPLFPLVVLKYSHSSCMGGVCRDEGVTNKWCHKHRVFLKQHDIRLKTVTLQKYVHRKKNIEFATFFILNAKELETMRLKFHSPPDITEGF